MMAATWRAYLGTVDPVSLPLGTLTVNLRHAAPSYHAISIPFVPDIIDALVARPTDTIRLYRNNVEWGYFNRGNDVVYQGATSKSVVLSGYRQQSFVSPATLNLDRKEVGRFMGLSDGSVAVSIHPDTIVHPQDTIVLDGASYTVLKLDYALSPGSSRLTMTMMEV